MEMTGPKISSRLVRQADREIGDDGGREEIAVRAAVVHLLRGFAAERDLAALFLREVDEEFHFLELGFRDDGALVGVGIEGIAVFQFSDFFDEALNEFLVGRPFDKDARAAEAYLALVRERRSHAAGDSSIEISVRKNDVWVFAAKFERKLFEKRSAASATGQQ